MRIAELGISRLRYPILWEKHRQSQDGPIDWSWTTERLKQIREQGIEVIAGLLHHGSGPAYTDMLDPEFPTKLAAYAAEVAEQFPWINYYTPVNEPLTTARFSGLYGFWYPHKNRDRSFLQMLINELKGTVLAMQAIRKINPQAKLVQTEDLGKTYSRPKLKYQAVFENKRRWLTFDLLCGRVDEKHPLWKYFKKFSIPKEELQFFLDNPCPPDIFGFNHYLTSERFLDDRLGLYPTAMHGGNGRHRYADVEAVRVDLDEQTGIEVLLREAWERYRKPMAVTEVHLHCHREEQLRWFKHVWEAGTRLREEGVGLEAITSWALLGSYGWNKLLREPGGDYEPGAFDLRGGSLRTTALARYIGQIAAEQHSEHPLSAQNGWWNRSTRVLYGPRTIEDSLSQTVSQPLLIIGKRGTLGKAFAKVCGDRCLGYELASRQDCDISDPDSVQAAIERVRPWAVINAAGFVRVDDAEQERDACYRDNLQGPAHLASVCARYGLPLLTFSSDLVFDGTKGRPYLESDPVNPLNVYGKSKAAAEAEVLRLHPKALNVRTSAFFGPWDEHNFAHWVRQSLQMGESIRVANDLRISPTYVPHLVNTCLDLLIDGESGTWHLANEGSCTWLEFANKIARAFRLDRSLLIPTPAIEMGWPAARPGYSVLGSEKGHHLPSLEKALKEYGFELKTESRKVA